MLLNVIYFEIRGAATKSEADEETWTLEDLYATIESTGWCQFIIFTSSFSQEISIQEFSAEVGVYKPTATTNRLLQSNFIELTLIFKIVISYPGLNHSLCPLIALLNQRRNELKLTSFLIAEAKKCQMTRSWNNFLAIASDMQLLKILTKHDSFQTLLILPKAHIKWLY